MIVGTSECKMSPHEHLVRAIGNMGFETKAIQLRLCAVLLVPWLASACATLQVDPLPEPIRPPKALAPAAAVAEEVAAPSEEPRKDGPRMTRTPGVVIQRTVAEGIADRLGENLTGSPVRVSFHDIPLIAFINEVFGEELGMSFVISPGLREKTDLVTLKLTEPLLPRQLFNTARQVLREYGVDLREVEAGVISFAPSQEIASRDIPLLVSGRALPEVPSSHRTIFQLVPLRVVRGLQVRDWLREAFERQDLKILEDSERNTLLLKGNTSVIARALAMIEVLDQPLMRGRHGIIIEPVFMEAQDMADTLNSVLRAEGYESSVNAGAGGSVLLLALRGVNKVVVFAADQGTIDHVGQWARTLDTRRTESIDEAVFTYQVRNTQAEALVETLNQMLGAGVVPAPVQEDSGAREDRRGSRQSREARERSLRTVPAEPSVGRIVVDKNRNMLLYRGTGRQWAAIRNVIDKLDRPVPSVLIEVLIAEITLADEEKAGFEFLLKGALGSRGLAIGTLGGLGISAGGLSFTLDSAGDTRAVLNLFYKDDRVVIRSRPRLLVKSGDTASIDVGNEIPVVTRISDSEQQVGGTTNVLQEVSYRKTGVQLEIKPLVQANGLVDLQISQQLSEARPTADTSLAGSPTILNRQISTSLTLRDGGSLLMGGLISGNQSAGEVGVPVLGRLPGLGRLFRTEAVQEDRTELMVMVTPYVIADHEEGWELTRQIRDQLDLQTEPLQ